MGRRITRPLAHLSETQRKVALSIAAGTTFIAVDALIAGIVIGRIRRQKAHQASQAAPEERHAAEVPDEEVVVETLVETLVEEFARPAATQ